jgi:predicted RNA-binding protein with TRAM domain/5-methylcytosine-specific restriction endonuclease McrA
MDIPEDGVNFTETVDRISSSGNGILQTKDGHINCGPLVRGSVGEEIEAKRVAPRFAVCLTKSVRKQNYEEKFTQMISREDWTVMDPPTTLGPDEYRYDPQSPPPESLLGKSDSSILGETPTIELTRTGIGGVPIGEWGGTEIHVPGSNVGERLRVEITDVNSTFAMAKEIDETPTGESSNSDNSATNTLTSESSKKKNSDSDIDGQYTSAKSNSRERSRQSSSSLDELRKRAEEAAVDEVPEEAITSTQTTRKYTRSSEVANYVKTRADGVCEGCGDPAPFTSKTGEPYLHAHHIHELSDGGADTPDTVVALCPNCHYRVHHGSDGEEYNQKLLSIVRELESDP